MSDAQGGPGIAPLPPQEIAARLRQVMAERGWNLEDLVKATGVSWVTLKRLLDPPDPPHPVYPLTLARLALVLDKPWHWLGAAPPAGTPAGPGRRVAQARLARGLSLDELAALTGLSTRTLKLIERGEQAAAHRRTWRDLAAALRVPLAWLLDGAEPSEGVADGRHAAARGAEEETG